MIQFIQFVVYTTLSWYTFSLFYIFVSPTSPQENVVNPWKVWVKLRKFYWNLRLFYIHSFFQSHGFFFKYNNTEFFSRVSCVDDRTTPEQIFCMILYLKSFFFLSFLWCFCSLSHTQSQTRSDTPMIAYNFCLGENALSAFGFGINARGD